MPRFLQAAWARLLLGAAILAAAGLGAGWLLLQRTVAPVSGTHPVTGLEAPAAIHFDAFERPFVRAETLEDALFAQGWLHASHRLWQMDLFRRAGKGRLAELLGEGMLGSDRELWRMGVPQLAGRLAANTAPKTHALFEAYVAGVNAALGARTSSPPEYWLVRARPEPWSTDDVYALGALMAYQTANNADQELLRMALFAALDRAHAEIFLPDDGARTETPFVVPPRTFGGPAGLTALLERRALVNPADQPLFPSFALGSNGWAVAPERTRNGYALFAFDSHDALALPNLFYEVHLFFGEERQLRGWSVAGLPGVINGFNEHVAWAFTNIGDSQDLFVETRDPEDPLRFRDGDAWYTAETETVEIPVSGRTAPETLTIVHTRNGPLLSEDPPIALRWTVHDLQGLGMDSLFGFNFARNWDEFNAAMDAFPAPALAATYADVSGNIGFRTAGLLPIRGRGEGLLPLAGDDPAARWQGYLDPSEHPRLFNPPSGFVAAANARVNAAGDGPLISADNAPGYRIRRIQAVLEAGTAFTVEDMRALQMDWHDGQAALLLAAMRAALDPGALAPLERQAHDALAAWEDDPVAAPSAAAPIVFQAWYRALAHAVFKPEMPENVFAQLLRHAYPLNHALDRLILREPDHVWWRGERDALLARAFRDAVAEIRAEQGGDFAAWRLDRMHRVRLEHELAQAVPALGRFFNDAPAPWGGGNATVGRARYRYDRAYDVRGAATVRFAGEMRETPNMASVMPGGQSGHPWSRHYADQTRHWLEGGLLPIAATPESAGGPVQRLLPRE